MKEYVFTEFISLQWQSFSIMFFTGCIIGILYKGLRKYLLAGIKSEPLRVFLELLFFLTAALYTGAMIDHFCGCKITMYKVAGLLAGVFGARYIIKTVSGQRQ